MIDLNKIVLGTVQFGLNYGINNNSVIPNNSSIEEILNFSYQNNIHFLDTANIYGNAQVKLGLYHNQRFNIISKFPYVRNKDEFAFAFKNTLSQLNVNSIYAYLAHDANNLIKYPELWSLLKVEKSKSKVKKIGFSLYTPEQLLQLLDLNIIPDIVQLPYSLLDRKFEEYLPILRSKGVEIHSRSVFLQGLYFINPFNLSNKLIGLKNELIQLNKICNDFHIDMNSLALSFVLSNENIDKIVIGIDNINQLKMNYHFFKSFKMNNKIISLVNKINVSNVELLNPSNW
jgi:aryl-alcohol dehydrogenase-like predicted oxidoreductase